MTSVALDSESYLEVLPEIALPPRSFPLPAVRPLPVETVTFVVSCGCLSETKTVSIPSGDPRVRPEDRPKEEVSCQPTEDTSPCVRLGMRKKCRDCNLFDGPLPHRRPDGALHTAAFVRRELASLPGTISFN